MGVYLFVLCMVYQCLCPVCLSLSVFVHDCLMMYSLVNHFSFESLKVVYLLFRLYFFHEFMYFWLYNKLCYLWLNDFDDLAISLLQASNTKQKFLFPFI